MYFFEIFAECSIALAGFGAVHAVLKGGHGPRGLFRAWTTVFYGILSFILSVLPLLLGLASLPAEKLWQYASAIGVVGTGIAVGVAVYTDVRMTRLGHPPQSPVTFRTAQLSNILGLLAMLVNLIGWPWPSGPLLYAAALVLTLITGILALLHSFSLPLELALRGEDIDSPDDFPATAYETDQEGESQ